MLVIWTDRDPTRITLPTPSTYSYQYADVDLDSGRNDSGMMMRNRVGAKVKLTLSWNAEKEPGTHARMISILKNLPPFFYCEYVDADNTRRVIECYHGDITTDLFRYDPDTGNIWRDTKVNFVER